MTPVILGLVALYLAKSFYLGYKAHKSEISDSSEDYFLAGRNMSWLALGFTVFASWMSVFAYLGSPGFYFSKGIYWMLGYSFLGAGTPLLLWFIGRKVWVLGRERGYITPGDLLSDFYGSQYMRFLSGVIGILALIPYSLIQLIGISKVLAASTQNAIPFEVGLVFIAITIAIYVYFGGIRAIAWTDIIQALIFAVVVITAAGIAMYQSGGLFEGMKAAVIAKPEIFVLDPSTVGRPLTFLLMWGLGFVVLPHMWQRMYMAKSAKQFTQSIVLSAGLGTFLISGLLMVIGIYSVTAIGTIPDPDALMPTLFETYFKWGLPFLVVGAFAAGMSTIDSQLITASSILVKDILETTGKTYDAKSEKKIGQRFVLLLIALMVILALMPFSRQSIVVIATKGVGIALLLFIPLIYTLFGKRYTKVGGITSLTIGAIALFILECFEIPLPLNAGPPAAATLIQWICMEVSYLSNKKLISGKKSNKS